MYDHPIDQLILELIQSGRAASLEQVARITERIATVPFEPRHLRVRLHHRGMEYQGKVLDSREESPFYHLVQRVLIDEQWAVGTTAEDYLADIREAARSSAARLGVFERRGGAVAVTLTPTALVLPVVRRGPVFLPELLVVYAADRGIIVTGYQISSIERTGIPEAVRWLR